MFTKVNKFARLKWDDGVKRNFMIE
jgi:hypothetical protein